MSGARQGGDPMARAPICFVTSEIFPGTPGGIGRLLQQSARALERGGWPAVILLDAGEEALATFRAYARTELPATRCLGVDELTVGLSADEDIPGWAFHYRAFHRAHRVALALRRLLRTTRLAGVEFPDFEGLGYLALKWRRLWGDELAGVPMWVRLHGPHELWQAADGRADARVETAQLHAMERYALRHADGWVGPSPATNAWLARTYGITRPTWHQPPRYERLGPGGEHPRRIDRGAPVRLLVYGKVQRLKGIDLLVAAAVELCRRRSETLEVDIVGSEDGHSWRHASFRRELEAMIPPELQGRFRFHGPIDPAALPALARACTLAVIPSRVETFCLAAHELNWIGIPLVLNDIPAFTDFFQDRVNCRTFDGTSAGLVRVLEEILDAPDPFAGWRQGDVAGEHDPVALYEEIVAGCRPPRAPAVPGTDGPRVSVVVPYFEMHRYVDETLASVQRSAYANWEIILVDDGSRSAAARAKLDELRKRFADDPRVRIFSKPNGGLGSARNFGIAHASGAYVLPLDSDDVIDPDYLTRAVTALEANPELAAVSCFVAYFLDGRRSEETCDYVIPYDLLAPAIFLENRAGVACSVFRRSVFDRLRYDEDLFAFEDWELWWQLALAGAEAETLPAILFRYRRRADSMANTVGYSRYGHLVGHMMATHRQALAGRWQPIVDTYAAQVEGLTAQCRALAEGATVPAEAAVPEYEYSVQLTWRILLRLLRARMRSRLAAAFGRRTVTVRVEGNADPNAAGAEVWVAGVRPAGTSDWRLDGSTAAEPQWELRNGLRSGRSMLVGTAPGATVQFRVDARGFGIGFLHHPAAGRATLTVDGETHAIDLYGRGAGEGLFDHFWTGHRWIARRER